MPHPSRHKRPFHFHLHPSTRQNAHSPVPSKAVHLPIHIQGWLKLSGEYWNPRFSFLSGSSASIKITILGFSMRTFSRIFPWIFNDSSGSASIKSACFPEKLHLLLHHELTGAFQNFPVHNRLNIFRQNRRGRFAGQCEEPLSITDIF